MLSVVVAGSQPTQLLTGDFVADQLAALDITDAGEERLYLLLCHRLRQIVYDQISLAVLLAAADRAGAPILLHCFQSVRDHRVAGCRSTTVFANLNKMDGFAVAFYLFCCAQLATAREFVCSLSSLSGGTFAGSINREGKRLDR